MRKIIGRLLTFATGAAAGILLMDALQRGGAVPLSPETVQPGPIQSGRPFNPTGEPAAATTAQPDITGVPASPASDPQQTTPADNRIPSNLPRVYHSLVLPNPGGLTAPEMHAMFKAETRDEGWAGPMEASINHYVAAYAATHGLVVEYVECRSRFCEVAGYAIQGNEPDFSHLWAEMSAEPWWDASGGMSAQYDGEDVADGQRRFIAILPRNGDQAEQ